MVGENHLRMGLVGVVEVVEVVGVVLFLYNKHGLPFHNEYFLDHSI
jgi:hypothetical protein